jgi:hypothetical protein
VENNFDKIIWLSFVEISLIGLGCGGNPTKLNGYRKNLQIMFGIKIALTGDKSFRSHSHRYVFLKTN